jgi:hypothetical protein
VADTCELYEVAARHRFEGDPTARAAKTTASVVKTATAEIVNTMKSDF